MTSLPTLLTTGEVAEALSVGPDTVRRWAETGQLSAIKLPSGVRRFRREDVERILQGGQPVADTGSSQPSFLYATSVVLAAILVGWTLPPGTGLFVLVLAAAAGLLVREGLRSHLNGLARLARAGHGARAYRRLSTP